MKKYSKQRELILNSLQNRSDHPTAETLYIDLKAKMPSIGIATIYRNLVDLCNEGLINKIVTKKSADRFDGNLIEHFHFKCDKCGAVQDIFPSQEEQIQLEEQMELFAKSIGAKKDISQIIIMGICKSCRKNSI